MLLMPVAQNDSINIFSITFALVEGETAGGWSSFSLKSHQLHVAPQPNLWLILDIHPSIESAYKNLDNGWQDPLSTHV